MAENNQSEEFLLLKTEYSYFANFFELIEVKKQENNSYHLDFKCKTCPKGNSIKSNSRAFITNLKSHMKRKDHLPLLSKFESALSQKSALSSPLIRKSDVSVGDLESTISTPLRKKQRQMFIDDNNVMTQNKVDRLVTNYITGALMPFTHVRNEAFKEMMQGLLPTKKSQDMIKFIV